MQKNGMATRRPIVASFEPSRRVPPVTGSAMVRFCASACGERTVTSSELPGVAWVTRLPVHHHPGVGAMIDSHQNIAARRPAAAAFASTT